MGPTDGWDDIWLKYHAVNEKKVRHYFETFSFSAVAKDRKIVDIGCGSGEALKYLKDRGYSRLKGVEREPRLFGGLDGEMRGMIERGDCLELDNIGDGFDIVLIFGVLHHLKTVEDMNLALRNVKRILKPGGRFYSVEQWKHFIRTAAMKLVRDTPVGLLGSTLRMERKLLELERVDLGHWLDVEEKITADAERMGLKPIFRKKDLRYRYIIFEKQ